MPSGSLLMSHEMMRAAEHTIGNGAVSRIGCEPGPGSKFLRNHERIANLSAHYQQDVQAHEQTQSTGCVVQVLRDFDSTPERTTCAFMIRQTPRCRNSQRLLQHHLLPASACSVVEPRQSRDTPLVTFGK